MIERIINANKENFLETVFSLAEAWLKTAKDPVEFTLETLARVDGKGGFESEDCERIFGAWKERFKALDVPSSAGISLRCWDGRTFPRNRYLLTEAFGVQVGKGFDPTPGGHGGDLRDELSLLTEERAREVELGFSQQVYRPVADLTLAP